MNTTDTINNFLQFNVRTLSKIDTWLAEKLGFSSAAKAKQAYRELNMRFIYDCVYTTKNKYKNLLVNPSDAEIKLLNDLAPDFTIDDFQIKPEELKFIKFQNFGEVYHTRGRFFGSSKRWAFAIYKVKKAKFGYYYERDVRYTDLTLNSKMEKHLNIALAHDHELKTIKKNKSVTINGAKYVLHQEFMKVKGYKKLWSLGGYLSRSGFKQNFKHYETFRSKVWELERKIQKHLKKELEKTEALLKRR